MAKVSIVIPSRNEQFLSKTVDDLFEKAAGDIEIIAVLDGWIPDPPLEERDRLTIIHRSKARGMRDAINAAAAIATGKYLMKVDAHCMFGDGYDEILQADCDDDWLVIPRRVSLDAENWCIADTGKSPVDYEYLSCPNPPGSGRKDDKGIHGKVWRERARERLDIEIDDNMSFQGSCWFMPKAYYHRIGGLNEEGYGTFIQEPQELGLKVWLGGGRQITNKRTWYAHLHKGRRYGRGYFLSKRECHDGTLYAADYWLNNRWENRVHDLVWLIEKFWPVPTWPENYPDLWTGTEWTP
jgi:glycosyltransferase involved in cell wall biosynthesis